MKKALTELISRCRTLDWTILYLRIFLGGILLLHNIGKMQLYNEIVNSYPNLLHLGSAASFTAVTILQVVLAVLLVLGIRVRIAALLLSAGMLAAILIAYPGKGVLASELGFVYMGTCIALVISGGGLFSFDAALSARRKRAKENNRTSLTPDEIIKN